MSPDTATSSSSGFTASPLAAGARGIPRDGWNSWGHPQGHLAAKTRCTCQQSVSPKEWLYSLPCTEPVNEKPWVLKAPSHHGCTCQVKWGGVTNHSTLCFLSAFPSLWHAGGWVALPACLPASLLPPCLPPCLALLGGALWQGRHRQPAALYCSYGGFSFLERRLISQPDHGKHLCDFWSLSWMSRQAPLDPHALLREGVRQNSSSWPMDPTLPMAPLRQI